MPKPASLPVWATDANFAAPGKPWDGTPTKVSISAGRQAAGWAPVDAPPAQHLNWMLNLIYLWLAWLNGIFGADDSLQVSTVYETDPQEHGHHASAWIASAATGGTYNGSIWTFAGVSALSSPMTYLRPGDHITGITWVYDRGGAGTVSVRLERRPIIGGGEAAVQTDADSTSASGVAQHAITYDHVVEAGYSYLLHVDVTDAANVVVSAHVTFNRPRP